MGCYHGKFTFDQLSHMRSCLIKQLKNEGMNSMRYPPHTPKKLGLARFFILKSANLGWMGRMALLAIMVVVAAVALQVSYTTACSVSPCSMCITDLNVVLLLFFLIANASAECSQSKLKHISP